MADGTGVREEGPVALVTGASGGIGHAIAVAMGAYGFRLCVVGRDKDRLARTAEVAARCGVTVVPAVADLNCFGRIEELGELVDREFGRLDVLVHSAGAYTRGEIRSASVEYMDTLYETNVRAPYRLTQVVLDLLIRSRGDVVFINSTQGESAGGG